MRVLVPTVGDDSRLAALLRARGADVTEVKVGEIVSVPAPIPPDADWLAIASKNAVPSLVEARRRSRSERPTKNDPRLAAVGAKTAAALEAAGFAVDFIPSVATGAALHAELAARYPSARVFDFKGYENRAVPLAAPIDLSAFDAALFTCASSVERVFAHATGGTLCCAIGPTTAAALARHGVANLRVAPDATLESLAATLGLCAVRGMIKYG